MYLAVAQDVFSKEEIQGKMKAFKQCKKTIRRYLTQDSVYFIVSCRNSCEYNYVEFYKLIKNKTDRKNRIILQFYFLNENLIFITQGTRNRKHFNKYYLNQGRIFVKESKGSLPTLTESLIDQLKKYLLSLRTT